MRYSRCGGFPPVGAAGVPLYGRRVGAFMTREGAAAGPPHHPPRHGAASHPPPTPARAWMIPRGPVRVVMIPPASIGHPRQGTGRGAHGRPHRGPCAERYRERHQSLRGSSRMETELTSTVAPVPAGVEIGAGGSVTACPAPALRWHPGRARGAIPETLPHSPPLRPGNPPAPGRLSVHTNIN